MTRKLKPEPKAITFAATGTLRILIILYLIVPNSQALAAEPSDDNYQQVINKRKAAELELNRELRKARSDMEADYRTCERRWHAAEKSGRSNFDEELKVQLLIARHSRIHGWSDAEVARSPNPIKTLEDRGLRNLNCNKYSECIKDMDTIVRSGECSATALYIRGAALFGTHDTSSALANFNGAIKMANPPVPEMFIARALVYYTDRDPDKSLVDISEALRLDPKSIPAYRIRASINWDKGQKEDSDSRNEFR